MKRKKVKNEDKYQRQTELQLNPYYIRIVGESRFLLNFEKILFTNSN